MKFNFKIQQYQTDAVDSVVSVFNGQPKTSGISYMRDMGTSLQMRIEELENSGTGFSNAPLVLNDTQLLENIRTTQSLNQIHQSDTLIRDIGRCSLDIEMETGTGKTYVYIKTMFELNKRYGWSKFVVVVPSVAIREGVKKSFDDMQEHFLLHYGKKAKCFIYNSSDLQKIDDFSSDSGIHVMIINTQAFASSLNEDKNVDGRKGDSTARIIYSERDNFGSRRPIDVLAANNPIIIMDEPQKMTGTVTQNALKKFKPLFVLNYSATHAKQHNLIYVLDALDAYNQRLVKRIEVKGFELKNLKGTNKYLYLESIILSAKKPPQVRMEIEVQRKNGAIKREFHLFNTGDDLYYISGLNQYQGYKISEIDPISGKITFLNGESFRKGEVVGDISERDIRRIQIRETILSHFEKEERLFQQGIKTLSLFFIDEVAKYRQYDDNGEAQMGEYGHVFEQEYNAVREQYRTFWNEQYQSYVDSIDAHDTHRGYFSIDKKGHAIDSKLKRGTEFSDDISAYDLILKSKERLLSFEEPTRFIFSHSALREGWDNPNVFQICTLKHGDSKNTTAKRQEVGRGLRLCVNQSGDRMDSTRCADVHGLNLLTVVASEGYASFVATLQDETKKALYNRPTKADLDFFMDKVIHVGVQEVKLDAKQAKAIYRYLLKNDYVDEDDKVSKEYRDDVSNGTLAPLPLELQPLQSEIHRLIQSVYDENALKNMFENGNATKVQENPLNERFYKKEFQTLWSHINHHTAYTVHFDSAELIQKAIKSINEELYVTELQYTMTYASQREQLNAEQIKENHSFEAVKTRTASLSHAEKSQVPYDLVGKIAEGTVLTRRTVATILKGISPLKFRMYPKNPEEFISKVIHLIKEQKATMIVEHITYHKLEKTYYSTIFTAERHTTMDKAYLAQKAIQDYVFTDGVAERSVERRFAEALDGAEEVLIYAKLPKGFAIPTPVGHYSPDWAVVFHEGSVKHIYFIAETKGTMESLNLRPIEKAKIECAKKLFCKLSNGQVTYGHVDSFSELMSQVLQD